MITPAARPGSAAACVALVSAALITAGAVADGCRCDFNGDHVVNGADIGLALGAWGTDGRDHGTDVNGDGVVNGADLGLVLGAWGPCAPAVPAWATVVEALPDPAVVTDESLRAAITATGWAWRVRDTATQVEMLLVPPGSFQMGCSPSLRYGCSSQESPVHGVTLTMPIYLGRYEVTQAQWQAKMSANPSYFRGVADSPGRPVEQVSWTDVQGYLASTGMRLPTEAEWEFACRAGTSTAFSNGSNDDATAGALAWYYGNSSGQTKVVGGRAPNALGFHDMLGNVWEWVADWYGTYPATAQTNPTGPASGVDRTARGGSWGGDLGTVRTSSRTGAVPGFAASFIGFRVARNP